MLRYIYQHSNKAFTIKPAAFYRLGGKEFLSQHVVPLNIFKGSLIIVISQPFSAYDSYFKNEKSKLLLGVERTGFTLFCTSDCKYIRRGSKTPPRKWAPSLWSDTANAHFPGMLIRSILG